MSFAPLLFRLPARTLLASYARSASRASSSVGPSLLVQQHQRRWATSTPPPPEQPSPSPASSSSTPLTDSEKAAKNAALSYAPRTSGKAGTQEYMGVSFRCLLPSSPRPGVLILFPLHLTGLQLQGRWDLCRYRSRSIGVLLQREGADPRAQACVLPQPVVQLSNDGLWAARPRSVILRSSLCSLSSDSALSVHCGPRCYVLQVNSTPSQPSPASP